MPRKSQRSPAGIIRKPEIEIILSGEYSSSPASDGRTTVTVKGFKNRTEIWLEWVSLDDRMGPELVQELPGPFDWRTTVDYFTAERELIGLPARDATISGITGIPAEILRMAWCEPEDAPPVAKGLASCTDDQLKALLPRPSPRALSRLAAMVEGALNLLRDSERAEKTLSALLLEASPRGRASIRKLIEIIPYWLAQEADLQRAADDARRQRLLPFAGAIQRVVDLWQARNRPSGYAGGMAMLMSRSRLVGALQRYALAHGRLPPEPLLARVLADPWSNAQELDLEDSNSRASPS